MNKWSQVLAQSNPFPMSSGPHSPPNRCTHVNSRDMKMNAFINIENSNRGGGRTSVQTVPDQWKSNVIRQGFLTSSIAFFPKNDSSEQLHSAAQVLGLAY